MQESTGLQETGEDDWKKRISKSIGKIYYELNKINEILSK